MLSLHIEQPNVLAIFALVDGLLAILHGGLSFSAALAASLNPLLHLIAHVFAARTLSIISIFAELF